MTISRITRFTWALLLASFVCGLVAVCFNVRLALLPAAVIFGWSQIGGL
jgi:hypothetical protein